MDLCQVFDQELDALEIETVQKETIHPRSTASDAKPSLAVKHTQMVDGERLFASLVVPIGCKQSRTR